MKKETYNNIKVNLIYFWERNRSFFENLLEVVLFPIWFPLLIICFPFMLIDEENYQKDIRWCKEHGKEYPYSESMSDGHSVVKRWKRELKDNEREKEKERIRARLQMKERLKEERNNPCII
jgi:hypothetical protein